MCARLARIGILKADPRHTHGTRRQGSRRAGGSGCDGSDTLQNSADQLACAIIFEVVRDGRDVAGSRARMKKHQGDQRYGVDRWVGHTKSMRTLADAPHYLEFKYEDLVTYPEETLRTVLEFLGEPWVAGLLEFCPN